MNNSCTDDGGVCTCNANIIGIKCDTCETGWFGFPSCQGEIYHYQWSTEPKKDLVLFHIPFGSVLFGSVLFGFFRKIEPNIYRIKSKIKGFHEVFNRNVFFFKNSVMREIPLLRSMDHSKISAVMVK